MDSQNFIKSIFHTTISSFIKFGNFGVVLCFDLILKREIQEKNYFVGHGWWALVSLFLSRLKKSTVGNFLIGGPL